MSATSFIEFAGASYFISEPDSPTPNQIAITLLRSGNLEQVAAAELSITGSMAQEDVDYQLPFFLPQDVVFESGEAQKTIVVEIQNDMDWEGLETVDFALSKPSLDTEIGSQSTTTLHILDYQTATVEFAREQYTIYESESGETQIALTLTRSGDLHQPAKVRIETVDSQAQEGIDFTIDDPDLSNEVLFEQGEATKTVILTLDKGFYPDPGETIQLGLVDDGDPAVSIGPRGTTTVEIRPANDAPGAIVEFAQARYVTMERETPDAIALTLNRTGDVNAPAEVQIQAAGGTAMEGEDYGLWQDHWQSLNLPESIRFEAGETSKTIFLDTWSDWILEGTEQVTFEIVSQNGQTTIGSNSSAVVDIQDAQLTYVAFAQDSYTVYEGNDSDDRNFLALTLVRTGDLSRFVEVDLLAMGGTATWGIDFYGPNFPETVTFASGETRKTIILDIPSNNWEQEGIEFFKFGLAKSDTSGDPNGADTTPLVIGEQSTTTIRIVEPNPMDQSVVAFKQASYSKGEGTTTAITLTRTGNVNQHAEVMLLLNGGTASYGQDYQIMIDGNFDPGSPTSTSITFAPGEVEKTIWVEVSTEPYPDQEGTEFFTLELASQDNNVLIGDTSTTRMNLLDAETAYVEFAQSRYVGYEGNSGFGDGTTQLAITLVRSGRVDEMVEARLVALGGTADWYGDQTVMGGDFDLSVSAGEVIRFEAGETTKTIIAEINADGTMEGLESFRFGLVGVGGAIAGDQSTTTLEIVDHSDTSGYPGNPTNPDDMAIVEFAEARYVDMEGDQARVAITVTRTGNLNIYSTVDLLPNGGTATRDVDYKVFKSEYGDVNPVTLPESLSFNYGEQSKTLLVELMPDQMLEGTEFVTFQLAAGHS
ncbi:MAG: Calx-beta domain-containing protein, partial [Elainellaceae cyanobacterium]